MVVVEHIVEPRQVLALDVMHLDFGDLHGSGRQQTAAEKERARAPPTARADACARACRAYVDTCRHLYTSC